MIIVKVVFGHDYSNELIKIDMFLLKLTKNILSIEKLLYL